MAVTLQQAGVTLVRFGVPALAPFIRSDLDLTLGQTGLVLAACDLGALASFYITGRYTDRFGDRALLTAGAAITGLLTAVAALSGHLASLLFFLVMAGLGVPSSQVAGSHAVVSRFPRHERGLAMGIRQAGLPAGGLGAAILLPWVASHAGWRPALALAGAGCLAGGILVAVNFSNRGPVAVRGGEGPIRTAAPSGPARDGGTGAFRWFFQQPGLVLTSITACLLAAVQFSVTGYLPLFVEDVLAWSPDAAGRLLMAVHGGGMVGRMAWGWLSDRLFRGERTLPMAIAAVGGGAVVVSFAVVAANAGRWTPAATVVPMILLAAAAGFTCLGWNGLYVTLLAELSGTRSAPSLGISMTMLYAASMLAPALFGRLVDASGSYLVAWIAAIAVQGMGLMVIARLRRALGAGAPPPALEGEVSPAGRRG